MMALSIPLPARTAMARSRRMSAVPDVHAPAVPTWEDVAREHGPFMYSVAFRLTGRHAEAEDIVQAALLRVRRGLETYEPGNLRGWLGRITTNVFLDDTRARKRRPVQALPDEPDRVLMGAPGADVALDAADLPAYMQAAIASLADDHRAAVVLCDVVGLSYPEIADALGVPVGTVRSRIHRGRSALRDLLRPHLEAVDEA
jgi:RNA polymerase sigma-70 factor (ECF subfamily)